MKMLIIIMTFLMYNIFIVASTEALVKKTTYIMVPEKSETDNYDTTDINIIGVGNTETIYSWKTEELEDDETGVIALEELDYYNGTKLLKLTMFTQEDEKVKIAFTYKTKEKDEYIILASEEVAEGTGDEKVVISEIKDNYDDEEISSLNLIEATNYDDFPGYEIKENVILMGVRVGNEQNEKTEDPSNIIVKLNTEEGSSSDAKGINILPSASWSAFHVTAKDDSASYGLKKYNAKKYPHPNYEKLSGSISGVEAKEVFVTPKNENSGEGGYTLWLNDKLITLEKGTLYEFYGDFIVDVINYGGNKWVLQMTGEISLSVPSFPEKEEGDDVYIIGAEGIYYEGDVKITSGNESLRKRESVVEVDVLNGNGIKIKSIEE